MDKQEGREGGTWLGMNKSNGTVAILLNILQPTLDIDMGKLGRGSIVNDFLINQLNCSDYCSQLKKFGSDYNGFLTISLQLVNENGSRTIEGSYYSNFFNHDNHGHCKRNGDVHNGVDVHNGDNLVDSVDETNCNGTTNGHDGHKLVDGHNGPESIGSNQIYGFGNSMNPFEPWPKVVYGKKRFESILNRNLPNGKLIGDKEQLINELFEMLTDSTKLPIDKSMIKQGNGRKDGFIEALSTLNVHIPSVKYGSRYTKSK